MAQENGLEGRYGVVARNGKNPLGGENGSKERRAVRSENVVVAIAEPDGRGSGGVMIFDPAPKHPFPIFGIVRRGRPSGNAPGAADFVVNFRPAEKRAGQQYPVNILGMAEYIEEAAEPAHGETGQPDMFVSLTVRGVDDVLF